MLLVGKRARILDQLADALTRLGLHVREETDIDRARSQIDGATVDVVAVGRAIKPSQRDELYRALRAKNPRLHLVQGLAPIIRQEIWSCLAALKAEGESILVIDKNVDALARIADRHIVLEKGRVAWRGSSDELRSASAVKDRFLHL